MPSEFNLAILSAVCIKPHADVEVALEEPRATANSFGTKYPTVLFISSISCVLPKIVSACLQSNQRPKHPWPLLHKHQKAVTAQPPGHTLEICASIPCSQQKLKRDDPLRNITVQVLANKLDLPWVGGLVHIKGFCSLSKIGGGAGRVEEAGKLQKDNRWGGWAISSYLSSHQCQWLGFQPPSFQHISSLHSLWSFSRYCLSQWH